MGTMIFILMLVAGAVALYGVMQDRQGIEWGRPVAIVAAVAAIALALLSFATGDGKPSIKKLTSAQHDFRLIAGEKLGRHLAGKYTGGSMVIIAGIDYSDISEQHVEHWGLDGRNRLNEQYLEGLNKGLDGKLEVVQTIFLPAPEALKDLTEQFAAVGADGVPEPPPPVVYETLDLPGGGITAQAFNEALDPYMDDVDIILMMVDFPVDVQNMDLWAMEDGPRLALMMPSLVYGLDELIEQGRIIAVVDRNPDYQPVRDASVPGNFDKAFSKRYVLITPENIKQLSAEYEDLFPE